MSIPNDTAPPRVIATETDEDSLQRLTEAAIEAALHRARRQWIREDRDATILSDQHTAASGSSQDRATSRSTDKDGSLSTSLFASMPTLSRGASAASSAESTATPSPRATAAVAKAGFQLFNLPDELKVDWKNHAEKVRYRKLAAVAQALFDFQRKHLPPARCSRTSTPSPSS